MGANFKYNIYIYMDFIIFYIKLKIKKVYISNQ